MIKRNNLKKFLAGASLVPLMLMPNEAAFAGTLRALNSGALSIAGIGGIANGDGFTLNNDNAAGTTVTIDLDNVNYSSWDSLGRNGSTITLQAAAIGNASTFGLGVIFDSTKLNLGDTATARIPITLTNTTGGDITFNGTSLAGPPADAFQPVLANGDLANDRAYSALGLVDLAGQANNLHVNTGAITNPRFNIGTTFANVGAAHLFLDNSAVFEDETVLDFTDITIGNTQTFMYENTDAAADVNHNINGGGGAGLIFGGADATASIKNNNSAGKNLNLTLSADLDPGAANTGKIVLQNTTAGATLGILGVGQTLGKAGANTLKEVLIIPTLGTVTVEPTINATALKLGDATLAATPSALPGITNLTGGSNNTTTSFVSHVSGVVNAGGGGGGMVWETLNYNHFQGAVQLAENLQVSDILQGAFDNRYGIVYNTFNTIDLNGHLLVSDKLAADGQIDVGIRDTAGGGRVQIATNTTLTSISGIDASLDVSRAGVGLTVTAKKPDGTAATAADVTLIGNTDVTTAARAKTITFPAGPGPAATITANTPLQFRNIGTVTNPDQAVITVGDTSSVEIFSNAVAGVNTINAVGATKSTLIYNVTDQDIHFLPQITPGPPVVNQTLAWNANTDFQFKNTGPTAHTLTLDNSFMGNTGAGVVANKGNFTLSALGAGDLNIASVAGTTLGGTGMGEQTESVVLIPSVGNITVAPQINTVGLTFGQPGSQRDTIVPGAITLAGGSNTTTTTFANHFSPTGKVNTGPIASQWTTLNYANFQGNVVLGGDLIVGDITNGAYDSAHALPPAVITLDTFNTIDLAGSRLILDTTAGGAGGINVGILDTSALGTGILKINNNSTLTSVAGIDAHIDLSNAAVNPVLTVAATKADGTPAGAADVTLIGNNNFGGAGRSKTITFPAAVGETGTITATTPLRFRNIAAITNPAQAVIVIPDNSSAEIFSNAVAGVSTINAAGATKSTLIYNVTDEDIHFLPTVGPNPQTLTWNANTDFQFKNTGPTAHTLTLDNSFIGNTGAGAIPNKGNFTISTSGVGALTVAGAAPGVVLGDGTALPLSKSTESITLIPVGGAINLNLPTSTLTLNIGNAAGGPLGGAINIQQANSSATVKFFQDAKVNVLAPSAWGMDPLDFNSTNSNVELRADLTTGGNIINGLTSTITLNDSNLISFVDGKTWNCIIAQGLAGGIGPVAGTGRAVFSADTIVQHNSLGSVNVRIDPTKTLVMNVIPAGTATNFTMDVDFSAAGGGTSTLTATTPVTISGTITNGPNGIINVNSDVTMTSATSNTVGRFNMGPDIGAPPGTTPKLDLRATGKYVSVIDFTNVTAGKIADVVLNAANINLTQNAVSPDKARLVVNEDGLVTDVDIGTWEGGVAIAADKKFYVDATGARPSVIASAPGAGYTFGNDKSALVLSNQTGLAAASIDLQQTITGGTIGIGSTVGAAYGLTLTSTVGAATLGTAPNPLPGIFIGGSGSSDVSAIPIFSEVINIGTGADNPTGVKLGEVIGDDLEVLSDVRGTILLAGNVQVDSINYNSKTAPTAVADGKHLNATNVTGGDKASLEFVGAGQFTGTINKLGTLYTGVGDVSFVTPGSHNIDNIYGTGTGTLSLAGGTTINGNIDNDPAHPGPVSTTSGAVNVTALGDLTVGGNIGTTSAIGNIAFVPKAAGGIARNLEILGTGGVKANSIALDGDNLRVAGNIATAVGLNLTNGAKLAIDNSISVAGPANVANSRIDVGGNKLTFNDAAVFTGTNSVATNVAADGSSAGGLAIGATGNLNAKFSNLNVEVNTGGLATSVDGKPFTLIDNTAGGTYTPGAVSVSEKNNPNVRWVYNPITGIMKGVNITRDNAGTVIPKTDAGKELSGDALDKYVEEVIEALPQGVLDKLATDPDAEVALLNELSEQPNDFGVNAAPVLNTILSNVVSNISNAFVSTVSGRVDTFNAPLPSLSNPCVVPIGTASGDCVEKELPLGGVWINPFYGYGKQKPIKKKSAGYNINTAGATVGVDGFLDENNVVGAAIGYADNKLKFSGQQKHDNTRAKTKLASAYWRGDLPGDNFMQVIGNVANHRLSTKERRGSDILGYSVATGSPKARSYGLEAQAGHNFNSEAGRFTPVVGIRQSNFKMNGYTEKNGHLYSLKHDSLKFNRTEGMAGLKWAMPNDLMGFTPEVHASVYHSFKNTKLHPTIRVMGAGGAIGSQDFPTIKHTLPKTSYNVGAGFNTAISEFMDLGANYDLNIGKKYLGHQGSFKIRAMF